MSKKIRSFLSIALIFVMVFSVCGCGGNGTVTSTTGETVDEDFFTDAEVQLETESNGTTASKTEEASNQNDGQNSGSTKPFSTGGKSWKNVLAGMPKDLRGTTIKVYNWTDLQEYPGGKAAVAQFTKETGIKVKWVKEDYETYTSKLVSMIASDTQPDVMRYYGPGPLLMQNAESLDVCGYDFSDAAWDQDVMKDFTLKGKVYGTTLEGTHLSTYGAMLYNKSLISKHGYDDPYQLWKKGQWTWEKFVSMCREFKKDTNAEFACGTWYDQMTGVFGYQGLVGFDGTKYYTWKDDPDFIKATQQIADLHNVEKLFVEWHDYDFKADKMLFWAAATTHTRRSNPHFANMISEGKLCSVPMPTAEGKKAYVARDEYESYGIVKGAKNAKAAPYFLRYFLDSKNYNMENFFCNNQAKEVYEWSASQPRENTLYVIESFKPEKVYGGQKTLDATTIAFQNELNNATSATIPTLFNSYSADIDRRVKKLNDALANIGKK